MFQLNRSAARGTAPPAPCCSTSWHRGIWARWSRCTSTRCSYSGWCGTSTPSTS